MVNLSSIVKEGSPAGTAEGRRRSRVDMQLSIGSSAISGGLPQSGLKKVKNQLIERFPREWICNGSTAVRMDKSPFAFILMLVSPTDSAIDGFLSDFPGAVPVEQGGSNH
jgi:hypothetical protein